MAHTTNNAFWTRTPADRNVARARLMAAGAGSGDSTLDGIVVPVLRGSADDVIVTAKAVDLREVARYYTVMKGQTVLMIELA